MRAVGDGRAAYDELSAQRWARLGVAGAPPLSEIELDRLRGLNEPVSLPEVAAVYLPLCRLLDLQVRTRAELSAASAALLDEPRESPFVLGLAGSVAVGKSTTARLLTALLRRWPRRRSVALVTTDGFLRPNAQLSARGLLRRKGFPESYDLRGLVRFLTAVKSGAPSVRAPVYSHTAYDVVPGATETVRRPDILIVEGLNVLQAAAPHRASSAVVVSDFFDTSLYVDAAEEHIRRWYVERFLTLRRTAFRDPSSYFARYADLDDEAAADRAGRIWDETNGPNLRENIAPTRSRAAVVLTKGADHAVTSVSVRRW